MSERSKLRAYDEDVERMFLCRPCAEKMKGMQTVESVRIGAPANGKGDCEMCGRRRYGYKCEVAFKEISKETTKKRGKHE